MGLLPLSLIRCVHRSSKVCKLKDIFSSTCSRTSSWCPKLFSKIFRYPICFARHMLVCLCIFAVTLLFAQCSVLFVLDFLYYVYIARHKLACGFAWAMRAAAIQQHFFRSISGLQGETWHTGNVLLCKRINFAPPGDLRPRVRGRQKRLRCSH